MKPIQLQVATPCQERWSHMKADEKGAFCHQCQKLVIDFSRMSQRELLQYFQNNKAGGCGKFSPHQLNRPMVATKEKKASKTWKKLAALALLATSSALVKTQTEAGKNLPEPFILFEEPLEESAVAETLAIERKQCKGRVVDSSTGEPLPFANVRVKGFAIGAAANIEGLFNLPLPESLWHETITLQVSYVGYEPLTVLLTPHQRENNVSMVTLAMEYHIMGEIVVMQYAKPRPRWQFWRSKKLTWPENE